jgi:hypothetical protein
MFVRHREGSEYAFLTREGIRQLFLDGGAVTIPEGTKYLGLTVAASATAMAELLSDDSWVSYQKEKAAIWTNIVEEQSNGTH